MMHRPVARRLAAATAVAMVVATALVGAAPGASQAAPVSRPPGQAPRVTITTPSAGLHEMPLVVGIRRGLYAEENLDVARVQMAPPVSVAAMIAGEADFTTAIGATTAAITGAGAPLKIVAGMAVRPLQVLVVGDPSVAVVTDLRGRAVGTNTMVDTTANLLRLALRAHGLEPQADVAVQPLGESPNRLAALQSRQVPAAMLDLAQAKEAERFGGRVLVAPADFPEFPVSGLGTSEPRMRGQPEQLEAVLRATLRAIRHMAQNREDTLGLMMDHMGLAREAAEGTYDLGIGAFARDGIVSDRGVQLLIDAAHEASGRQSAMTPADVADLSAVRRAAAQVGP
jgi:ABC-type nitrate/sulfonate/bicarbonate transport system substrate-binding protein